MPSETNSPGFRRRVSHVTVGVNKGRPRIWLEGKYLAQAGFKPQTPIELEITNEKVIVRLSERGQRRVASKAGELPVIDIERTDLAEVFDSREKVEVVTEHGRIEIRRTRVERQKRAREKNGREGSAFSGGGLLTQAAKEAGFKADFAIELEDEYAEIFETNHPEAEMHNVPIEQIDTRLFEDRKVELVTLGIPCQPFSRAWRNTDGSSKRDTTLPPESHDLGYLTYSALKLIDTVNPYTALIENVPGYLQSGAFHVLKGALKSMGYNIDARVLSPLDFGGLTDRKRAVIIATTDPVVLWPVPTPRGVRTLAEILEPEEAVEHLYFDRTTKEWLYRHWDRQTAKGNGFASQVVSRDATSVGVIKKGYMKEQGDNPVLAHPTKPDTHRWFTLTELKRLHHLPDDYHLGKSKRIAGEIIGQGVDVGFFKRVILAATGRSRGITGEQLDRVLAGEDLASVLLPDVASAMEAAQAAVEDEAQQTEGESPQLGLFGELGTPAKRKVSRR